MAMTGQERDIAGLRREWFAARIFAVLGGLLLAAIVVLAAISVPTAPVQTPRQSAPIAPAMARALCTAGLASAQAFALVPAYTKLAGDLVQMGAVKGRYMCFAQTDAARYQIAFDLMCRDLNRPNCVRLYSVVQDGTGAIYQRR
jgi:hypothetical protein